MTRINTISPSELHTVHLIAEYRELPRVFDLVIKAEQRGFTPSTYGIPKEFTLGAGHMKFFADKLLWLYDRFEKLVEELRHRNINIAYTTLNGKSMPCGQGWWEWWEPTDESKMLIRERIAERIAANPRKYK